jgi:erythromycin esterase-like protein
MAQDTGLHTRAIRENTRTITVSSHDFDSLIELAGDSRFALLGEASHGTRDFITRARSSRSA